MAKITISTLDKMKAAGEKFVCITAYDATFARLVSEAGAETILVGDSLGMVL
ncbi:MAG: 3-methyl-2-oxobutanoate hydroxymethyltransferase, partial [Glaciecola sp.]